VSFVREYLEEVRKIADSLDLAGIHRAARMLADSRFCGGRLFVLGIGGSAANASHAVNDFRKIAGFEAYTPTDNVAEITARANDEGWATIFQSWLADSRLQPYDSVLVLSVGGGNLQQNVSPNLVMALEYARLVGAKIIGIVGRDGGFAATVADVCIIVPTVSASRVTPHVEAFQSVILHLLVSHPDIKQNETKWESLR
jgi:D-sedoheptulose 7-phosphate isomerase